MTVRTGEQQRPPDASAAAAADPTPAGRSAAPDERAEGATGPVAGAGPWIRRTRRSATTWARSLLVRVVALTLIFSTLVMLGLGLILQQQITAGLLTAKQNAAINEIENARVTVEASLAGAASDPSSLRIQLQRTLSELGRSGDSEGSGQAPTAGVFEPVIVPTRAGPGDELAVGPIADVPADLRASVVAGNLAWQYANVQRDGANVPALVVGTPATTATDSFEVYLIFLLTGEQETLRVVQNTLLLGGIILAVALTLIAALVAWGVVRPVRRAAGVAERLAAGDLAERMPVKGATEITTLARSFNGMADAIRAQIRQLEAFGALQRRFTSDVSHELRTPVTTVRMAADVLHAGREDFPPHLARATELLVAELDRFEALLADLLEISRYDAGMAELSAEVIDIRSTIDACVEACGPLADNAGVTIRITEPDRPVVAEIDNRRVERILRNLLNNAIDHANGGPVDIELAADDSAVAVAVTDYGVGLKPGEASLVFNRFWRADPSRQRQTGGTGLGLAISLEDARLHGGWLQASGEPGAGARFRLTLPRKKRALVVGSPLPLRVGEDDDTTSTADEDLPTTIAGVPR